MCTHIDGTYIHTHYKTMIHITDGDEGWAYVIVARGCDNDCKQSTQDIQGTKELLN